MRYQGTSLALLHQVAAETVSRGRAYLRGEVIGPRNPLFTGTELTALYVAIPVYFPDEFNSADGVVFAWLVPITTKEAVFVSVEGWKKFEIFWFVRILTFWISIAPPLCRSLVRPMSSLLISALRSNRVRSSSRGVLMHLLIAGSLMHAQASGDGSAFQPNATLKEKAAAQYLLRAAEAGSAKAQSELSRAYMAGYVFKRNIPEAVRWVTAAASQGLAEAEVDLAVLYLEGTGVPRDYSKGFFWMKKAADQGNPQAEYNLGLLYGLGRGVGKDIPEGVRWYLKAAESGDPQSAYNMGLAYEQGVGVSRDLVKAYMWHYLAANRFGYSPSQELLRELGGKIGPAKVEEARQQAAAWIKSHPNVKAVPM
jgi:hypothetical protein